MTEPRLFGTDGVRARFGEAPLDRRTVGALAHELGRTLGTGSVVVLGGDTRYSTPSLVGWIAAGLAAAGTEPRYVGVAPTPAVARLVPRLGAAGGVVVSASHNPWTDNGIKLFDELGCKWEPAREVELERRLEDSDFRLGEGSPPPVVDAGPVEDYLRELRRRVDGGAGLSGLRVVLDCAHGAASPWAGPLFASVGAEVETLAAEPDGRNINAGFGSTAPAALSAAVVSRRAHLGLAFDGDADRVVLVDERGEVRDGDAILFLWARELRRRGELEPAAIVATSMSNLGLERALAAERVRVVRCDVGDRAVVRTLRSEGLRLGGEQSGHIVDLAASTTGDGLLTGLEMASILARAGRPLSELLAPFRRYPQLLRNVVVRDKPPLLERPSIRDAVASVEHRLGDDGRLVLRYSGTEPLARVMIEGPDEATVEALAAELAGVIQTEIGAEE